jgi:molybdenum-dependent DNA-binding transcriptional regulator ModE
MVGDVLLDSAALLARCAVARVSRGGPGGQHANKTASGVRLIHMATGFETQASEHREGAANREAALRRMRLALACGIRGGADPAWLVPQVRRGRLACGPEAPSWPAVVAVLLDALAAHQGSLAGAAEACGLSTTQFAKALASDQPVRAAADVLRRAAGMSPIRA